MIATADSFSAVVGFEKNRTRIDWKCLLGAHEQTKTGPIVLNSFSQTFIQKLSFLPVTEDVQPCCYSH